jgi:hypothetical protein
VAVEEHGQREGQERRHPQAQRPQDGIEEVEIWQAKPLEERLDDAALAQQRMVAEDLSLLYERLVEGKPCPPITYRTQQ